jgi:UDP-2,3-diacylglucosamine pyrophosphatase LpxH
MIIAVSDVHLGYYCADAVQFKNFLKNAADKSDVDQFVLLGDIYRGFSGESSRR